MSEKLTNRQYDQLYAKSRRILKVVYRALPDDNKLAWVIAVEACAVVSQLCGYSRTQSVQALKSTWRHLEECNLHVEQAASARKRK
jgi:hypothetical protein